MKLIDEIGWLAINKDTAKRVHRYNTAHCCSSSCINAMQYIESNWENSLEEKKQKRNVLFQGNAFCATLNFFFYFSSNVSIVWRASERERETVELKIKMRVIWVSHNLIVCYHCRQRKIFKFVGMSESTLSHEQMKFNQIYEWKKFKSTKCRKQNLFRILYLEKSIQSILWSEHDSSSRRCLMI